MPETLALPRAALPDTATMLPREGTLLPFDAAMPSPDVNIRIAAVPDPTPPYDDGDTPGPGGADPFAPISDPLFETAFDVSRPLVALSAVESRSPGGHWPSQFAQVLAETLAGSRPASQLAPWTTDRSRRRIGQLGSVLATPHRPRIRRVIVTSPASGVLEMSIIAVFGNRVRALAVRLERAPKPASEPVPDPAPARRPGRPPTRLSANSDASALAAGWYCTAIEAA